MLTPIERHNLINRAGQVAGSAIALAATLANEGAPSITVITSALVLAQQATELQAKVQAAVQD